LSKKSKTHSKSSFGQARSKNDFRRRQGQKAPGKVMIIVCEGKETEPNYFGSPALSVMCHYGDALVVGTLPILL